MKVLHIQSLPGENLVVTPFLGWEFDGTFKEFEKILKEKCFTREETKYRKLGYPAMKFTLIKGFVLVFTGSYRKFEDGLINPNTKRPYRWAIFKNADPYTPIAYIDIEKDWHTVKALLPNKEEQDKTIAQITAIIEQQGFIEIKL